MTYRNSALLGLLCLSLQAAPPEHPRLLFNRAGIEALQQRVQRPEWAPQWKNFQAAYDAGMTAAIELPPRGSNWYHWYVCPKHGVRLVTGRKLGAWQWEHVCPADNEILRGDPAKVRDRFRRLRA